MIRVSFATVRCGSGRRIGVPARELVNAFVGRRSHFARSSLPEKPGSQQANSGIAWQSAFGHGSLIEGRPSGECRLTITPNGGGPVTTLQYKKSKSDWFSVE
jgi:hypothetical protein